MPQRAPRRSTMPRRAPRGSTIPRRAPRENAAPRRAPKPTPRSRGPPRRARAGPRARRPPAAQPPIEEALEQERLQAQLKAIADEAQFKIDRKKRRRDFRVAKRARGGPTKSLNRRRKADANTKSLLRLLETHLPAIPGAEAAAAGAKT